MISNYRFFQKNLRPSRFIYNKTPRHHIVESLLFCGEPNHKKSYTEYKSGKYLSEIAIRCFSKRHATSGQISYHYSESHFAESRLLNRAFHNRLVNPNKQETQNKTKNVIIGKPSKLCFARKNIVGNTEDKSNEKITYGQNKHINYKSGKSFPKTSVTKSCILWFHMIKNFSFPQNQNMVRADVFRQVLLRF